MLIEDAASGQFLSQSLQQETALAIKPVKPDGAKEVRAVTVTPLWEAKRV
jgi:phage terminase large subunit-like protein